MAKNLLDKLNVLVQASIRDTVGSGLKLPSLKRAGKNLDREVAALRQDLNTAMEEENTLQAQVTALEAEILRLDELADRAVMDGRDAEARHTVAQMQRAKQQLTMVQSDLDHHRYALQELMQQVNRLESIIEVAKREASAGEQPLQQQQASDAEGESDQLTLSAAIRKARESVHNAQHTEEQEQSNPIKITGSTPVDSVDLTLKNEKDDEAVEQDIAARRTRLQKPGS